MQEFFLDILNSLSDDKLVSVSSEQFVRLCSTLFEMCMQRRHHEAELYALCQNLLHSACSQVRAALHEVVWITNVHACWFVSAFIHLAARLVQCASTPLTNGSFFVFISVANALDPDTLRSEWDAVTHACVVRHACRMPQRNLMSAGVSSVLPIPMGRHDCLLTAAADALFSSTFSYTFCW